MMIRKTTIVFIGLWLSLVNFALAQRNPIEWDKVKIISTKLSDNLYMFQFLHPNGPRQIAGGNVVAFLGPEGVLLGDSGFEPMAPRLEQELKKLTDKPVKYVVNTHWHRDHSGANGYFSKTATVIGHENGRRRMIPGNAANPAAPPSALPSITFSEEANVHINGAEFRAIHFGRGHTDGDSILFFPDGKAVELGDFSFYGTVSFPGAIDQDTDGTGGVEGVISGIEYIASHTPDDVKVVPGHGDLATKADLLKYLEIVKGTAAAVENGVSQGKSLDQLKADKIFAKWTTPGEEGRADAYLDRLYKVVQANHQKKTN